MTVFEDGVTLILFPENETVPLLLSNNSKLFDRT